jgi:uncharacterized protein YydD (DUF2326 family)
MNTFRRYAREFYGDKAAGLVVTNSDGYNQTRYNIEARIEHDQADGINDVRIFCFDMTLLALQQRHNVEFLVHDSRLLADMDWRQRLALFRLADNVCQKHVFQYIAMLNEDQVEILRDPAGDDYER